jgi:hypothetical protein
VFPNQGYAEYDYGFCEKSWKKLKEKTEIPRKVPNVPVRIRGNFVRQLSILEQSPCVANYVFVLLSLSKVEGAWNNNVLISVPPWTKDGICCSRLSDKKRR